MIELLLAQFPPWIGEHAPLTIAGALVLAVLREQRRRDKYMHEFFMQQQENLGLIGGNCHDFSEATEERSARRETASEERSATRETALIESNTLLLNYLTKLNGGT